MISGENGIFNSSVYIIVNNYMIEVVFWVVFKCLEL